ncbi:MAG: hypothetical protein R2911_25035 [Caldilineaceae bacterium]
MERHPRLRRHYPPHEVLDALLSETLGTGHDIVKAYWTAQRGENSFDAFWQQSLHDGAVADSALPAQNASPR